MRIRCRVVLPTMFGAISFVLLVWDLYTSRAGWDIAPLLWPHRIAEIFNQTLNAPAFVLATPYFLLPHVQTVGQRFPVILPLTVLWWWWLGSRIDFGILGRHHYTRPKLFAAMLTTAALVMLFAGVWAVGNGRTPHHILIWMRTAGFVSWALGLALGCLIGARNLIQGRFPSVSEPQGPIVRYGFAFVSLVALATNFIGAAAEPKIDPDSCVVSNTTGCVHGTVSDIYGTLLKGVEVEIVPADKTGESRWMSRKFKFTDKKGRYSVNGLDSGKYLVVVHYYDAPHDRQPFAKTFYPGTESENEAESVSVSQNSRTMLGQLRLRSLRLATIKINVYWSNRTRPSRSNLAFHNLSYPDQAVIGDVAPEIDEGQGEFTLPEGFEYTARATVQCEGQTVIESRESRPIQEVKIGGLDTPQALTFTIPGPPCKLWEPR